MIIFKKYYFIRYETSESHGFRVIGVPFYRSAMYATNRAVEEIIARVGKDFVITDFKRI